MSPEFTATYSAEDNKLRLYADERLEKELYDRVHKAGFKYAPVQKLFVAPKWTPYREDLCIELAGEITAEESTMIERAEAKADRLDTLAAKRTQQASAYHQAADKISDRFAYGQPILVGHHSEGKARRDQKKMQHAVDAAIKAQSSVSYWHYRAEGVERHANRKANPAVRLRRIKTLLVELRDRQRDINHAHICLELWQKIESIQGTDSYEKKVEFYAGAQLATGSAAPYFAGSSLWDYLRKGEMTSGEVVERCLANFEYQSESPYTLRWISHILNRLAFERSELGEVSLYSGELTASVLQLFARTHGAHKPQAEQVGDIWLLKSSQLLPAHISNAKVIELDSSGWCELMQSVGYEVPAPKARRQSAKKQVPLINPTKEEAEKLQAIWNQRAQGKHNKTVYGGVIPTGIKITDQSSFSANSKGSYTPYSTIELDLDGNKVWHSYKGESATPVCRIRTLDSSGIYSPPSIVVLEDKPAKLLPINWSLETVEA